MYWIYSCKIKNLLNKLYKTIISKYLNLDIIVKLIIFKIKVIFLLVNFIIYYTNFIYFKLFNYILVYYYNKILYKIKCYYNTNLKKTLLNYLYVKMLFF